MTTERGAETHCWPCARKWSLGALASQGLGGLGQGPSLGCFCPWLWGGLGWLTPSYRSLAYSEAGELTQCWLGPQDGGRQAPPTQGLPLPLSSCSEAEGSHHLLCLPSMGAISSLGGPGPQAGYPTDGGL